MRSLCLLGLLAIGAGVAVEEFQPTNVRLAWDASPDTNVVSGYALCAGSNSGAYPIRLDVGTNLTARIYDLKPGRWYFVAVAYTYEGVQSPPSNEVTFEVPNGPTNVRSVILQHSVTVSNYYDAGFFRLKIP